MALTKLNARSTRTPCRYCRHITHGYWFRDEGTRRPVLVEWSEATQAAKKGDTMSEAAVTLHRDKCGPDYVSPNSDSEETEPTVAEETTIAEAKTALGKFMTELNAPKPAPELPTEAGKEWTVPAPAVTADKAQALVDMLASLVPAPVATPLDEGAVRAIVEGMVKDIAYPTVTVVVRNHETRTIEGSTHRILGTVVRVLGAGQHVMMVGPAGTGKSTIAHQAADALGLPFYGISLSPQTPASALFGYMNAQGDYVPSLFRKWYEGGGVFNFDEIDNSHPSILAAINGSLANGHAAFPDGMVQRHTDAYAAASANTYGRGADRRYVGRQALDAATLDRFAVVDVVVDEALETALAYATGLDRGSADSVLRYVRAVRAKADGSGLPVVVSPRASQGLCALIAAGVAPSDAIAMRVRRGLTDQDWSKISEGVTLGPVTVGTDSVSAVA